MKPVRLEKVNGQFFMSQEDVEELRSGLRIMSVTHSNQLAKILRLGQVLNNTRLVWLAI